MSADVLQLPDRSRDLAAAREVIRAEHATDEQLIIACDVLIMLGDWYDVTGAQSLLRVLVAKTRRLNDAELASIGYPADGGTIGRVLDGQAAYQAAEGGRGETRMMLAVIAVAFFCAASLATFAFGADVPGQYAERGEW